MLFNIQDPRQWTQSRNLTKKTPSNCTHRKRVFVQAKNGHNQFQEYKFQRANEMGKKHYDGTKMVFLTFLGKRSAMKIEVKLQ
jgi:hypothetical protein